MSRIGKMPITVPAGVTVTIEDNHVTVKGPKGELARQINKNMKLTMDNGVITVERPDDEKESRSLHGLSRTLINNMIIGVTQGYQKALDVVGVGYRAQMQGKNLVLTIGYSHPVEMVPVDGIAFECPTPNKIIVKGIDKQLVGAIAANVRSVREPEPYHGKGIKYETEVIRRKEGKTGKK